MGTWLAAMPAMRRERTGEDAALRGPLLRAAVWARGRPPIRALCEDALITKKPGRPPRAGKRSDARLEIRLTRAELAAWKKDAAKEGMSLSQWIRFRCDTLGTRYPV